MNKISSIKTVSKNCGKVNQRMLNLKNRFWNWHRSPKYKKLTSNLRQSRMCSLNWFRLMKKHWKIAKFRLILSIHLKSRYKPIWYSRWIANPKLCRFQKLAPTLWQCLLSITVRCSGRQFWQLIRAPHLLFRTKFVDLISNQLRSNHRTILRLRHLSCGAVTAKRSRALETLTESMTNSQSKAPSRSQAMVLSSKTLTFLSLENK